MYFSKIAKNCDEATSKAIIMHGGCNLDIWKKYYGIGVALAFLGM